MQKDLPQSDNPKSSAKSRHDDLLKISATDLIERRGAALATAYADFPYLVGHDESGTPCLDSIRAEVVFTSEADHLQPRLRCSKCQGVFENLYMYQDDTLCAKCLTGLSE